MRFAVFFVAGIFLLAPAPADAQSASGGGFVNANLAIQEGSRTLAVSVPAELFGSSGALKIDDSLSGGTLIDVSGGARGRRFAFGVGYSRTRVTDSLDLTASTIPFSPGSFTRSVRGVAPDLRHEERVVYVSAAVIRQVTHRFDVMVSAGPAFFTVRQDLPTAVTLDERRGAEIQGVSTRTVEESAVGLQFSLDLAWMIRPHIGVGGVGRYSRASVHLPDGTESMTLGGVTIGLGLRARF